MTTHQLKHLGIQAARRCTQLGTMGLIVALAVLSLYAHYRAARALEDNPDLAGWRGSALTWLDRRVSAMEHPQAFLDAYKGTLWSMRLGGLDLSDPLAATEMTAAARTIHGPMILSIVLPVAATLVLGKVFCSWLCPANLLFEITGKLRKLLRLAELPPAKVRFSHRNKYVFLAVGLLIAGLVGMPMFALIYPPAVLSRLAHAWIFGTALTGMLVLMGLVVAFEVCVSPRWWCRTMCPGGALYGLLGWRRLLRVRLDPSRCTQCGRCEPLCEPGLNPALESDGIECDNCGACIRHCPERALYYTIGLPGRRTAPADRSARTPKVTAALLVLFGLGLPGTVEAHHILGLPHYSYKENYPQVPTLEYPATTGPYDVLLTSYPGKPAPGEPANLVLYIKDRTTGKPYGRSVTLRVLRTFTFGRNEEVVPATLVQPYDQTHKLCVTFPDDGEYVIELTLDVEGQTEVIPFMMIAGQPTAAASIVAAIGIGLALFIIIVRAIKIKRDRRAAVAARPPPPRRHAQAHG